MNTRNGQKDDLNTKVIDQKNNLYNKRTFYII